MKIALANGVRAMLVSAILVSALSAAGQQTIYVNQNAPAASLRNGTSWSNAFVDLQAALAAAQPTSNNPVSIFVAVGTYKPTTGTNQSASFVLKSYLRILGGFFGNETDINQRPGYGAPTVLSGDIGVPSAQPLDYNNIQWMKVPFDPTDPGIQDNCYNVLSASNVTGVLLDRLYITGGYADVSTNAVNPTELLSMAVTAGPTNSDESFSGETILPLDSRVAGGGLFLVNPESSAPSSRVTLLLSDCSFVNNGARGYGGGVALKYATVELVGTTFANNFAGQEGGGYWGMNCLVDFSACTFATNVSFGDGGGAMCQSMPTDYTVDPAFTESESDRQTTENIVGSALDGAKFATKLYALPSVDGGFMTKLRTLLPGNPFEAIPAGASAADQAAAVGSRLTRSLNWVTLAVTAVDFVSDIVSAAGGGNSAFVRDWSWFSANFNNYCTPQGWIYYLFQAVGLIRSPSPDQKAVQILQSEAGVYNQAEYSTMIGCQFVGNTSADEGGAAYCLYDNMQIEDCVFERNGAQDAGALANFCWTSPKVISCAFVENYATAGQSAVVNAFHTRATFMNCTFSYNVSVTAGYAMGNQAGADVTICNSIFWGNTNFDGSNFTNGADIFTSVATNLDSTTLSNYNTGLSDGTFVDWIATCDVSWSCVQSLYNLPLGVDNYFVVFPEGFAPSHNELENYLAQWNAQLFENDLAGLLDALGYINTGQGFRASILDPRKGNFSYDPLLINGFIPSRFSPVLDRGNSTRLDNGVLDSLTDLDAQLAPRFAGPAIDIGAVEYQGGADPALAPGFPIPSEYQSRLLFVSPGGRGTRIGNDWADATGDLRSAMTNTGFQVWVAAGTYYPTTNSDRTATFSLGLNCQVYGGFAGNETNVNQRNWSLNPTILSGDIGVRGNATDNSFHVMANTNIDSLSVLDGFTITQGRGTNGGGVFNWNSYPILTNCTFIDNVATLFGGAIYSSGIQGSSIHQCAFANNSSGLAGGAVFMNSATFVENSSFVRNTSALGGAICFSNANYDYVFNSLFVSNSVAGGTNIAGGAIEAQDTALTVFNSTFSLNYDAVAGSASPHGAAGIDFQSSTPGQPLFIENSIFWQNFATNALGPVGTDEEQQITTNSDNPYLIMSTLIQGLDKFAGAVNYGNIDVDPLFANPGGGDFSLVAYSPAIDAGNQAGQSGFVPFDLAGNPRVINQSIDLGAYEYQGAPIKVSVQISVARDCDDSGAVYALQLQQLSGATLALTGFQWEVNKNDGAGFTTIADGGVYSGTLSSNLTVTHPTLDMNGYRYRVVVSSHSLQFSSQSVAIHVSPTRFYVNAGATGAGTGLTWTDAFTDLQSALAAAQPCSQIWVAAGTYYPSASGDINAAFQMRSDIGIYGGFTGNETNLAQRNWTANPAILSGDLGVPGVTNDNSLNVIFNEGNQVGLDCDSTAILDGFTVCDAIGSGMINFYASPTVRNCVFTNNSGQDGGAMRNFFGSSPLVVNCVFENNSSPSGGAVDCSQGANAVFVNCLFANNNSGFEGGAAAVSLSDVHLVNCTVANNFAVVSGGGIYSQSATIEFLNSILWGNTDQEQRPSPTGPQIFLDTGGVLNATNSCIEGSVDTANGNLAFDPLFAGASVENFRLTSHSPAIDHGNSAWIAGYYTDLDGGNRVVNSAADMGAYEYQFLPGAPVDIVRMPLAVATCSVLGEAMFSVTGTNGTATSISWLVNKNDGLGFVPVVTNASAVVLASNATSSLVLSSVSPAMSGYLYLAQISSIGFTTPPVSLTVQLPGIIYVNGNVQGGSGNGASWANAFSDLQRAIDYAPSCSEIWVAQGSYSPHIDAFGSSSFRLVSGVGVYGGFAGTETSRSQRNWTNHPVLLVGGNGNFALVDNTVQSAPIDGSAVLDGFVFAPNNGFSVNNYGASPTIQNCIFTSNYQFAIFNRNSSPSILACVFTNNAGVSVYNQLSSPSISACVFTGNQTGTSGGAIYDWQSSPLIADCLFTNNSASSGGAIYNDSLTSGRVDRCRFLGNSSTGPGGAVYNSPSAAPSIFNSLFDQNISTASGGAIADYGGGMSLVFCTLARNKSSYSGAGLYFQGTAGFADSCIFWDNSALQNPDGTSVEKIQVDNSTGLLVVSNSIVQGLASPPAFNNLAFDPLFANLANGNFQLTAYSPAINSGDTVAAAGESADLSGQPRVFGVAADRGAYEFQSAPAGTLSILGLPQSITACASTPAQFDIVTKVGDTNTFQWQMVSGTNFVNVPNSPPYSISIATNTNSLLIPAVLPSMNGAVFRFVSVASGYVSPAFTLTMTPASIVYVNENVATPGNGSSWSAALTNLQTAFSLGNPCTEIWVARGTYIPTVSASGNPSLVMKQGLRVYGGFAGFETNLAQRNWTTNIVVLKGFTNEAVIENIGGAEPIDSTAVLDGFVIDGRNYAGNAILNINASPVFQNCSFVNGAPAMWNAGAANPVVLNCVFSNNLSQAMVNEQSAPVLSNCLFVANSGNNLEGGAIYNTGANPSILVCQFLTNTASEGAAISLDGNSTAVVKGCLFVGNTATAVGAVYCANSSVVFADDLFAGNIASEGGALFINNAEATVNNCTLTANAATSTGGGIVNQGGTLAGTNSIFWNNTDSTGSTESAQINNQGGVVTLSHSIVTALSAYAGLQNSGFDPLFQAPSANNFAPISVSPAINAGLNSAVAPQDVDFNGNPRIVQSTVDIGAVEFQNIASSSPVDLVTEPVSQGTCPGGTASFTVVGGAGSGAQFAWQVNTGSGFQSIPNDGFHFVSTNNNSQTVTISNTPANFNYSYRFQIPSAGYTSPVYQLAILPPRIIYVNAAATGNGTGTTWTNAFVSFAAALASGDACSQVWVAAGHYAPLAGQPAQMRSGLQIYGGFAGTETNLSQRNWAIHPSVLSAGSTASMILNQGYTAAIDRTAVLDGFVVTSPGGWPAIQNDQASPTIRNCLFQSNVLTAIENASSSPLIDTCVFSNNTDVSITILGGAPVLTNCVFASNNVSGSGGAIFSSSGAQTSVLRCLFGGNTSSGDGGAIENDGASISVVDSIFAGNSASGVGGAAANEGGGAAYFTNAVFYGGSAFGSGAIYNGGTLTLVNCTITANITQSQGGAISSYNGTASLFNTILWQNTTALASPSPEARQIYNFQGAISASHSLIQGLATYAGNANIASDPLFLDPDDGNYQLSSASPAINAGLNSVNNLGVDAAGQPRVQFGTIDMGAYESPNNSAGTIHFVVSPASVSVCGDADATLAVQTTTAQNFLWQYFDGANWAAFTFNSNAGAWTGPALGVYQISSNALSSTLLISGVSPGMNGYKFRFMIPSSFTGSALELAVLPSSVIYVNANAALGGDGQSWGSAYRDLQSALLAVRGCQHEIWVASGSYAPASSGSVFSIPPGATLYGGFTGVETSRAQRNFQTNLTYLTSQNPQAIVNIDGSTTAIGPETVVDGFILQGASGPALNIVNASPSILNCDLRNNNQGALLNNSGATFQNCAFLANQGVLGAGLTAYYGNSSLVNCQFIGNTAAEDGGAIYLYSANLNLTNDLIAGNFATSGAGIDCDGSGSCSIVNCTIADNTSFVEGAGLFGSLGSVGLANSIVWNNTANGAIDRIAQISGLSAGNVVFSCVEGFSGGQGNISYDPLFVNPSAGQYSLQSCSPALDAGNNSFIAGVTLDLAGAARVVSNSVDMGAYEFQGVAGSALKIVTQPATNYYCARGVNVFEVGVDGAELSYQWEADYGQGFAPLSDNAKFSGSATAVLSITGASSSDNGAQFRCVVASGLGCSVVSDSAPLIVSPVVRYYVNAASAGGDGSSWARAFRDIAPAMDLPSGNCDIEVWVAQGTYTPPPQGYSLPDSVAFYGGFVGVETSLSQRNWNAYPTILDGQNAVTTLIHNIYPNFPAGPLTRLDGFTLQNARGSAISNYVENPTLANCLFRANGKAIYDYEAPMLITNCAFLQNGSTNVSDVGGGAIYYINPAGSMVIENSLFQGNADGANGGAIGDDFGDMTLVNCLFSGNSTPGSGGAVSAGGGALITVRNCTVAGNQSGYFGAGLSVEDALVYNSIFWNNYCQYGFNASQHTNETAQLNISDGTSNVFDTCIDGLTLINGPFSGNGNIGGDPEFVGGIGGIGAPLVGGDFHVISCSPTIGVGDINQINPGFDLDGNPRISGGAVDLGAYEGAPANAIFVTQPRNQSGGVSNTVQYSVVSSKTNVTYQWQFQSPTGASYTNLTNNIQYSGVTTPTLTVSHLVSGLEGYRYRCEIVDQCSTILSAPAMFHFLYIPPIVSSVTATNYEGFAAQGHLQGFDPQGFPLTYIILTPPANGFVDLSAAPHFQYIASNRFFFGNDSFTYYVSDGFTNSTPATVNVTLTKVEQNPTAVNLSVSVAENTLANFALSGSDINGDPLTFLIAVPPQHGGLNLIGSNVFYMPATNYSGSDTFIYQSSNGVYASGAAFVSISVIHGNRPPVANPDSATIYNGQTVSIPVLQNDSDLDDNPLSVVGVTQGTNGSVTFTPTNVTYVHNGSNTTNDFFHYTITDGQGNRVTGSVSMVILQPGTSFLVTTNADTGPGSLRAAMDAANTVTAFAYQIIFSPALAGQTINLSTTDDNAFGPSAFVVSNNLIIDAANAPRLQLLRQSLAPPMRLFRVPAGARLALRNIGLGGGYALGATGANGLDGEGSGGGAGGFGGAIYSEGNLSLDNVTLAGNRAVGGTGGTSAGGTQPSGGNGGGVNGGTGASGTGGFGGGGAGALGGGAQSAGGGGGFGSGQGGGNSSVSQTAEPGGTGGFGGGGGSGGGSYFTGGGGAGMGGAIFVRNSFFAATNCSFVNNSASGGVAGGSSGLNYQGFSGQGLGGGVFNYNGTAILSSCSFENNSADQCDGLFSVGDNASVTTTLLQSTFANLTGLTDFVQAAINGGSAAGTSDNLSAFTQNPPFIRPISNQTIVGPISLNFVISEPVSSPFIVSASSSATSVVPNSNVTLSGSGTVRTLALSPIFGASGEDNVTVSVADGNLSMAEIVPVTVTRNLTVVAPLGGVVAIPVFQTGSGWTVTGVGQAASGSTAFNATGLTYSNYGAFTTSDGFTFQFSNGSSSLAGSVSISVLTNVVPVANGQSLSTFTNTPVPITLSGADLFNDPLTFTLGLQPQHGILSGSPPNLTYSPAAAYSGPDGFTFHVNNRFAGSADATVSIAVRKIIGIAVTNSGDSGPGNLRAAVSQANADNFNLWRITFAPSLQNSALLLSNIGDNGFGPSALVISNRLVVDGANLGVSIGCSSAGSPMRLFRVATNAQLTLLNLTLTNGQAIGGNGANGAGGGGGGAGMGGAIFNEGELMVSNVVFAHNQAIGGIGGQYNTGGQPDTLVPGGTGGGVNGGTGQAALSGTSGGFGGGGAGGGTTIAGWGGGGTGGFGAIAGGSYPVGPYTVYGGAGGFGGGGGGGWVDGGGGGAGMGGAIFNRGGSVSILNSLLYSNSVAGGRGYIFNNAPGAGGAGFGGAVFNYNGVITISNTDLTQNSATNGAGIYNVGDGMTSQITLDGVVMTNNTSADFVQGEVHGGFATTAAQGDVITLGSPWMRDLSDQTAPGAVTVPLILSAPLMSFSNRSIIAVSDNSVILTPSNLVLTISNVSGALAIHPTGSPGSAGVTVTVADGNLSYSDTFKFTLNYNLSAVVDADLSVSIPVFGPNSPFSITGVTQGANGTVAFTAGNLTYTETSPTAIADSFTYSISDGVHSFTGIVSITIQQTTLRITSAADDGTGSLRAAIAAANGGPSMLWHLSLASSLAGQTILLSTIADQTFGPSALAVAGDIVIDGSAAPGAVISRNINAGSMRLFLVSPGATLTLNNLSLEGGFAQGGAGGQGESAGGGGAGMGGAVLNAGSFSASNTVFSFNAAGGGAGGDFVPVPSAGNGGGPSGGTGGLSSADPGLDGGFGSGGGGGFITNELGNGESGGFGAGNGGGSNAVNFGGLGGFGGGGGSGLGGGGGGGLGSGGALFSGGSVVLNQCFFLTNSALAGAAGQGYMSPAMDGTPGNAFGGALFNYNGQLAISNCIFSGNMASNGDGLYVLADGNDVQISISGVTANDPQSGIDFVPTVLHGGSLQILGSSNSFSSDLAPFIHAIANVATNRAFTVSLSASAPALGGPYSIVAVADNPALFANSSLVVTGSGSNAVLTATPVAGQSGSALITVTVIDTGVSVSTSFDVTITAPPPALSILSQNQQGGAGFHLHFQGGAGASYSVQATTNLTSWTNIGVGSETTSGIYDFIDTNAPSFKHRYYRIK